MSISGQSFTTLAFTRTQIPNSGVNSCLMYFSTFSQLLSSPDSSANRNTKTKTSVRTIGMSLSHRETSRPRNGGWTTLSRSLTSANNLKLWSPKQRARPKRTSWRLKANWGKSNDTTTCSTRWSTWCGSARGLGSFLTHWHSITAYSWCSLFSTWRFTTSYR